MKLACIGAPAPPLAVAAWVQGMPTDLAAERGKVVLVEVFQVNCPGCFLYGIPQAMEWAGHYESQGLRVIGLATAFEDFELNTLENLQRLATTGEVVGETLRVLGDHELLQDGRLPYRIPFPLAMDRLEPLSWAADEAALDAFLLQQMPDLGKRPPAVQRAVREQMRALLAERRYRPVSFETYGLRGTPSSILVDRTGILRHIGFGREEALEGRIRDLLRV